MFNVEIMLRFFVLQMLRFFHVEIVFLMCLFPSLCAAVPTIIHLSSSRLSSAQLEKEQIKRLPQIFSAFFSYSVKLKLCNTFLE